MAEGSRAARLAELEERARRLRARLAALHGRMPQGRWHADHRMRSNLRCPHCGCTELLHSKQVLDRADGMVRAPMALAGLSWCSVRGAGIFEVWVCRGCRAVEWYLNEIESVKIDGKLRQIIESADPPLEESVPRDLPPAKGRPLEARIAATAAAADALRAAIDVARDRCAESDARSGVTMRAGRRCPGCGGGRLLHSKVVNDYAESGYAPMALAQKAWRRKALGQLEVWVCTGCGLVEWYVTDPSDVEPDGTWLVAIDASPPGPGGAFR